MFESVFVYTITALVMYLLARCLVSRENNSLQYHNTHISIWSPEFILTLLFFGFIAGARYNVGVDYLTYLSEYQNLQLNGRTSRATFEPGFILISKVFALNGVHFFYYFAFWGILQLFFVYYALKDRLFLLPYVALSIMLGPFFLTWMNGIRQCVAICAFVYITKYIVDRKFLKYAIWIILLSFIHNSALILLPIYFIFFKKYAFQNNLILLICLFICIILGATPTWIGLAANIDNILSLLGYDYYAENISSIAEEAQRNVAWGPSRISILLIDIFIIWFYPQLSTYYKTDKYLSVYFFLFLIGAYCSNLFMNTSHIFLRPIGYFTIFNLPLIAYLLCYFKNTNKFVLFMSLSVIVFSYIYFIIFKSVYLPTEYSERNLYRFFFQIV